jgi:hypothetical protein
MKPRRILTRCVAIAVASCLAGQLAWGHNFPPVRTVVVQVESCEIALLIGYRPGSGEDTETLFRRIGSHPRQAQLEAAKTVMGQAAMGPLTVALDGKPLVPTSVRAKLGTDPGGTRPLVVMLVTFAVPRAGTLSVTSREPRSTRISWTDHTSNRVDLQAAPAQGRWHVAVASFLLSLAGPPGVSACATSQSSTH